MAYYKDEWEELSLSDYYLMRIAQRIHQSLVRNPGKITLEDQKIVFKDDIEETKMSIENATAIAKARWGVILKSAEVKYKVTKSEDK